MRMVVLCAAVGAVLVSALPASAEVVIREGGGVVVRDRDHDDGWRNRHRWERHHAECRVVRVRTELPNGKVIFKTRRDC